MEKRKLLVGIAIIALALAMAACGTTQAGGGGGGGGGAGPAEFLEFGTSAEISALQARGAECGMENGAYWFSGAKTALESGTYEILFIRQGRGLDARPYEYLEFEMSTDNLELFDEFVGFFPRLRTGETYTQFNGSAALLTAASAVSAPNEWVKVAVSIDSSNAHERGEEIRVVLPRIDSLLFRFICDGTDSIPGKIFIRNIGFR